MNGLRPVLAAQINGADALFIADSGAFYSMLAPSSAAQFKLRLLPAPYNFHINGIGGSAEVQLTRVDRFSLADIPFPHAEFVFEFQDR